MALISCPECKKQISNLAKACPHCGYPLLDESGNKITIKNNTGESLIFQTNNNRWKIDPGQTITANFTQGGCFSFSYDYEVTYKIHDRDVGDVVTSNYYICSKSANFITGKNYNVTVDVVKTFRTVYHSNGGFFGREKPVDKSGRDQMFLQIKEVPSLSAHKS